jgi:hypothetical protein
MRDGPLASRNEPTPLRPLLLDNALPTNICCIRGKYKKSYALSYDQFDCFCLRIWNFAQLKVPTASRELLVRLGRTTRSAFCRIATSVLHLPSIHLYMHEHLDSLGADCPFWCLKPHVPRRPSSPRRSASCDAAIQRGGTYRLVLSNSTD